MNVTLTVTAGPHAGREFAFDRHDTFLVGRSKKAHLQLSYDDPYFSREHFLVEVNPPRVRVTDLKSRNGISVNGQRVKTADLKDGDELKAGHTVFKLRVPPLDNEVLETLGLSSVRAPSVARLPSGDSTVQRVVGPTIPGYAIETEIGSGNMGAVYRATRASDGRAVAIKVIKTEVEVSERNVQRFLREASIMSALQHRNIVQCFDSGVVDGAPFLVMELMDGTDLSQRIKDRGPMEVVAAVRLSLGMLDGLTYAHAQGFVHRDVKPGNLLLDGPRSKRVAKISDFGLARVYDECNLSGITMTGEVGGTPAFMPPEQATHYRDVKPAADQYSAAATLYYLLSGQFVLDFEPTVSGRMVQIVTDARVPLRQRRPDVPAGLEAAVMKALSVDPGQRYRDVSALREAVRPFA